MKIDIRKIFMKRVRIELKKMGFNIFDRIKIIKNISIEMINDAIGNFVNPKDFVIFITQ